MGTLVSVCPILTTDLIVLTHILGHFPTKISHVFLSFSIPQMTQLQLSFVDRASKLHSKISRPTMGGRRLLC